MRSHPLRRTATIAVETNQKGNTIQKSVFLLHSMRESFERAWQAADEDKERCIAYVMPILYANLTPEHPMAEWYCERKLR